jgi:hypothetical protein
MRVVCVVVGRRRPQHRGQSETPHCAEERERQFVCSLMLVCGTVVDVSTSTEMGSGYWEVTLAPRGLHPCFVPKVPVIRLTFEPSAGRDNRCIRYTCCT